MKVPVCVKCGCQYRCKQNGVTVLGKDHNGEPDVVYQADLFECPGCEDQVITGWGQKPLAKANDVRFDYWSSMATMSYQL